MMSLTLECTNELLRAAFLLIGLAGRAHMKCTSKMFSLTVSYPNPRFIVTLQMMPQFFTRYSFDTIHHSKIPLRSFYNIIMGMQQRSYFSMSLVIELRLNCLILQFWQPSNEQKMYIRRLSLSRSIEDDVGQIDLGTFVSIDSDMFLRIVTELNGYPVRVTLKDSRVKFCMGTKEIVLFKEEGQCIIDGVTRGEEIEFQIAIHPVEYFYNLASKSQRVWLFKTIDSCSMLIVPIGMFAQYKICFPNV